MLKAKSSSVHFEQYDGGHSYLHWRGSISKAMKKMDELRQNDLSKPPLLYQFHNHVGNEKQHVHKHSVIPMYTKRL